MKPTYRESWAGNSLMHSDLTLGTSFKVMGWESSDAFRFNLVPPFKVKRGQPNLKMLIT